MPVYPPADFTEFVTHGSTFAAYVNPSRGSAQLCAWRLTVPPNLVGAAHRPSREEVLLVLDGRLHVTIDDDSQLLEPGAVVLVPTGALLRIDTDDHGGSAWVTTTPGLTAALPDGTTMTPPWTR